MLITFAPRAEYDLNENDRIDTSLLSQDFCSRVDCLITKED